MAQANQIPLSWFTSRWKRDRKRVEIHSKNTIPALDGVRAIAALLVVTLHINEIAGVPWDVNQNPIATAFAFFGRTGVVLFFVLSGFLLFMPYARALLFQEAWPSARTFYLRRIFRIWPGYYFTLAAMILLFSHKYLQPAYWPQLGLFLTPYMSGLGGAFGKDIALWGFVFLAIIPFCYLFYRTIEAPGIRLGAHLVRKLDQPHSQPAGQRLSKAFLARLFR